MTAEPVDPPVASPQARRVILGVLIAMFVATLNGTVVAVALPTIAEDLDGFGLLAWVIAAYLVASTVVTPIYGKLCDLYGVRRVLALALGLFLASTVLCAASVSMPMLVAARVVQGIGGGGLITLSQAAIAEVVSLRDRGRWAGHISTTFALSSVIGPVLGGYLTERLSWPWVFLVSLPIGLLALVISWRGLASLPVPGRRRRIDWIGSVLLASGVSAVLIAITRIGQGAAWNDRPNLWWLGLAIVLVGAFAWREARADDPVLPVRLLRHRIIALGLVTQFAGHALMIALTVMVPLQMQVVTGVGAGGAGRALMAMSLGTPLGSFIGGFSMTRTGRYRPQQMIGAALCLAAMATLALTLSPAGSWVAPLLGVIGFGFGLQFPTTLVAIQNAAPAAMVGSVTAAVAFVRSLGAALLVAGLSTVLLLVVQADVPGLADAMSGTEVLRLLTARDSVAAAPGAAGAAAASPAAAIGPMRDAAAHAFRIIYGLCALGALGSLVLYAFMPERPLRT
jgi:EmrB/QacA subfamily drug resistance transporter